MKLYLDTCCLHRPFDDQRQPRVAAETEAIVAVLAECDTRTVSLVSSDAVLFEVAGSADANRRRFASEVLAKAALVVDLDDWIVQRGSQIEGYGIQPLDALHLAFAEAATVGFFCTCDDRLLKRVKLIPGYRPKAVSPLELVREILP